MTLPSPRSLAGSLVLDRRARSRARPPSREAEARHWRPPTGAAAQAILDAAAGTGLVTPCHRRRRRGRALIPGAMRRHVVFMAKLVTACRRRLWRALATLICPARLLRVDAWPLEPTLRYYLLGGRRATAVLRELSRAAPAIHGGYPAIDRRATRPDWSRCHSRTALKVFHQNFRSLHASVIAARRDRGLD